MFFSCPFRCVDRADIKVGLTLFVSRRPLQIFFFSMTWTMHRLGLCIRMFSLAAAKGSSDFGTLCRPLQTWRYLGHNLSLVLWGGGLRSFKSLGSCNQSTLFCVRSLSNANTFLSCTAFCKVDMSSWWDRLLMRIVSRRHRFIINGSGVRLVLICETLSIYPVAFPLSFYDTTLQGSAGRLSVCSFEILLNPVTWWSTNKVRWCHWGIHRNAICTSNFASSKLAEPCFSKLFTTKCISETMSR